MPNFRALPLLAILIACSLLLAPRAFADPTSDRIAALLERYRCPVFAYLLAIHKTPTVSRLDNRFLILEIAHRIDHGYYAQCAFDDLDRKMICEVSSPAFHPDLKPYFEGASLKRVKALGYQARRKDNYFQWRDAGTPDALYAIAGLLVETLGRWPSRAAVTSYIFDMQPEEGLTYEAPLVPTKPDPPREDFSRCASSISTR